MNLSRRKFISAAGMGMISPALFSQSSEAQGGVVRDYGLDYLGLQTPAQQCDQWCWAASISTIFGAIGHPVPQREIVRRIFSPSNGTLPCRGASDDQMLRAISQNYQDDFGQIFRGAYYQAKSRSDHPMNYHWWDVVKVELMNQRPLLAAYNTGPFIGHAVVITHVRIVQRYGFRDELLQITIRDPWPDSPNHRVLRLHELSELSFVAAVSARVI